MKKKIYVLTLNPAPGKGMRRRQYNIYKKTMIKPSRALTLKGNFAHYKAFRITDSKKRITYYNQWL